MRKQLGVLLLMLVATLGFAQQTVLTVPSADVLDKGKAYVRADLSYASTQAQFTAIPNVIYGVGKNIEVGVNAESFTKGDIGAVSIVPTIKWRAVTPNGEGLFVYFGEKAYLPVHNKTFSGGNFAYGVVGLAIDGGLRVGAGAYNAENVTGRGNRSGALLTLEKAVNSKFSLLADWQSGNGPNGYTSLGVGLNPTKKISIQTSYQLGNSNVTKGNHGVALSVGYAIN